MKIQQAGLNNTSIAANNKNKLQNVSNSKMAFGKMFLPTEELERTFNSFAQDSFDKYIKVINQNGRFNVTPNSRMEEQYNKWHNIWRNITTGIKSNNDASRANGDYSLAYLESCNEAVRTPNMLSLGFWNGKGLKLQADMPTGGEFTDVLKSVQSRIEFVEGQNRLNIDLLKNATENLDRYFSSEKIDKLETALKKVMSSEEFENKIGGYKSKDKKEAYLSRLLIGVNYKISEMETL